MEMLLDDVIGKDFLRFCETLSNTGNFLSLVDSIFLIFFQEGVLWMLKKFPGHGDTQDFSLFEVVEAFVNKKNMRLRNVLGNNELCLNY